MAIFENMTRMNFPIENPKITSFSSHFHSISEFQLWRANLLQNWLEFLFLTVWLLIFTWKNQKFRGISEISRFSPSNSCKSFFPNFATFLLLSFTNLELCPSLTLSPLFYTSLLKMNFGKNRHISYENLHDNNSGRFFTIYENLKYALELQL